MVSFKEFISESIEDRGIFKAVFVVGIPGSGKSYTGKKISGAIQPRVINTDIATEYLTLKTGRRVNSMNWIAFQDQTHRITKGMLGNYLNGMLPLLIDGTSNSAENILQRAGILKSLGYDVGMVFVDTPLETALKRAATRQERDVDPEFIQQVYKRSAENKEFFKQEFSSFFAEIKNDEGELTDAVLRKAFASMTNFYDAPIANPIGKRMAEKIRSQKSKYLSDVMDADVIKHKIDGWYK
jgi:shikimate kinase